MNNALIIFTRVPIPGATKTRLMPFLNGEECAALHSSFLKDVSEKARKVNADVFVFYTPRDEKQKLREIMGADFIYLPQYGEDLGVRMKHAIGITLHLGYEKSILMGTDIPQFHVETMEQAFTELDEHDVVIHPTLDGGYYLIGMKEAYDSIWKVKRYGTNTVIQDTLQHMEEEHLSVATGKVYYDIDDKVDLYRLYEDMEAGRIDTCPHTYAFLNENLKEKMVIDNEES